MANNNFPSIDSLWLSSVTGGAHSSKKSSGNDAIKTSLQAVTDSLSDLKRNQSKEKSPMEAMLPMMMMMKMRRG